MRQEIFNGKKIHQDILLQIIITEIASPISRGSVKNGELKFQFPLHKMKVDTTSHINVNLLGLPVAVLSIMMSNSNILNLFDMFIQLHSGHSFKKDS